MAEKTQLLNDLLKSIDSCTNPSQYYKILSSVDIDITDISPYVAFLSDTYSRNLIKKTDGYELIAICWRQGMQTSIHNHNFSRCWVKIIEGSLLEEYFNPKKIDSILKTNRAKKGDVLYIDDNLAVHKLNCQSSTAVSLHLYSPPINWCYQYDPCRNIKKRTELNYDREML
jgi:cysteine dioxygenase